MVEPSPSQTVVERLLEGITQGAWDALPSLYSRDAVVELPFAVPALQLRGRDAIRAHFERVRHAPLALRVQELVIHKTDDPEVVIAEYDYHATVTTSGQSFVTANVQIIRVRDGEIVASRDFHDHAAIARALGMA